MAFRSAAVTTSADNVAATLPTGLSVGDYMAAVCACDFGGITIPTPPTGWVLRAGPTTISGDGQTYWVYDRIADGNESTQRTFNFNSGADHVVTIYCWSGRNTSAPRTFLTNTTPNTGANNSPVSVALTGGTAVAGDDLFWVGILDANNGGGGWSGVPPLTPLFTERSDTSSGWTSLFAGTIDNVSAGATGTLTGIATSVGNSAAFSGVVIAIAAAAGVAQTPGLHFAAFP